MFCKQFLLGCDNYAGWLINVPYYENFMWYTWVSKYCNLPIFVQSRVGKWNELWPRPIDKKKKKILKEVNNNLMGVYSSDGFKNRRTSTGFRVKEYNKILLFQQPL